MLSRPPNFSRTMACISALHSDRRLPAWRAHIEALVLLRPEEVPALPGALTCLCRSTNRSTRVSACTRSRSTRQGWEMHPDDFGHSHEFCEGVCPHLPHDVF